MAGVLSAFFFPLPASLFLNVMSVLSFPIAVNAGISEASGKPLQYSKFWNARSKASAAPPSGWRSARISSREGMLLAYTPSFLAAAVSFYFLPPLHEIASDTYERCLLLSSALAVHFLKRVLEVLFVHQYSGNIMLESAIPISMGYFTNTVCMIYAQNLTLGMPEPSIDLRHIGMAVFLMGIVGNFYHHYLFSKLRDKKDKTYKIPTGGLFGLVICPHYLFEIITFLGLSLMAQTVYGLSFTLWTASYLMGRSYLTRNWYLSKFDSFPRNVKALVPFVF